MALARKLFPIPSIVNAWAGSIRRKFEISPIGLQQSSLNGVGVFPSSSGAFTRPWRQTSPGHLTASVTVTKCNEYHIIETKTQNSGIQWLQWEELSPYYRTTVVHEPHISQDGGTFDREAKISMAELVEPCVNVASMTFPVANRFLCRSKWRSRYISHFATQPGLFEMKYILQWD